MSLPFDYFLKLGLETLPGNSTQLKLGLMALILGKNILIEDIPGVGKTTFVKFFSKASGLKFQRIQFTSDLLPSDILGINIFHKETESFIFRPGPIFSELILADELNRGTPKTQSALLQAMEEKKVTIDGVTHNLPENFSIFATQNPRSQFGTNPLPESQLDRFLFKFSMGVLTDHEEVELLKTGPRLEAVEKISSVVQSKDLNKAKESIQKIKTSELFLNFVSKVLKESRNHSEHFGLSTRAGLDLLEASKAWAFFEGRDYVLPDDLEAIFPFVAGHRMFSSHSYSVATEFLKSKNLFSKVHFLKET